MPQIFPSFTLVIFLILFVNFFFFYINFFLIFPKIYKINSSKKFFLFKLMKKISW